MSLILATLAVACAWPAAAKEEPKLASSVKASLAFHEGANAAYPHVLQVFLRLENTRDGDVTWVADAVTGIEAELLDSAGRPVPEGGENVGIITSSITHNASAYLLPYGSKLDWMVSHGGVNMAGKVEATYALIVGGHGWLIPMDKVGDYSLRVRLKGEAWTRELGSASREELLLELPPTKIDVVLK